MKIDDIINLLQEWGEFTSSHDGDIYDFGLWLIENKNNNKIDNFSPTIKSGKKLTEEYSENSRFLASYFINRLNKFMKIYTKVMFTEYGLNSVEDFSFLALIEQMNNPSKKDLCDANLTEVTTGMDIIKRLQKRGLVEEDNECRDKRMKRMKLTDDGKSILKQIYLKLSQMEVDVLGDLNIEERNLMIK